MCSHFLEASTGKFVRDIGFDHPIGVSVARIDAIDRFVNLWIKYGLRERDHDFAAQQAYSLKVFFG